MTTTKSTIFRLSSFLFLVNAALGLETDFCYDSKLKVHVAAKDSYLGCNWLTNEKNENFGYGCQNEEVASHCKEECRNVGACDTCKDSALKFQYEDKDMTCEHNKISNGSSLCQDPKIQQTCPLKCGICDDTNTNQETEFDCKDSNLPVDIEDQGLIKGCGWLANEKNEMFGYGCNNNKGVQTHCPEACDTCDVCADSTLPFLIINEDDASLDKKLTCETLNVEAGGDCENPKIRKTCPKKCGVCDPSAAPSATPSAAPSAAPSLAPTACKTLDFCTTIPYQLKTLLDSDEGETVELNYCNLQVGECLTKDSDEIFETQVDGYTATIKMKETPRTLEDNLGKQLLVREAKNVMEATLFVFWPKDCSATLEEACAHVFSMEEDIKEKEYDTTDYLGDLALKNMEEEDSDIALYKKDPCVDGAGWGCVYELTNYDTKQKPLN